MGDGPAEFKGTVYGNGDRLGSTDVSDTGYLHGKDYKVAADLENVFEVVAEGNDTIRRRALLRSALTLTQQSNVTTRSEYDLALKEGAIPDTKSGTFYVLLPYGADIDLGSVRLDGGRVVQSYAVQNYRESGRAMLVVKARWDDNIESPFRCCGRTTTTTRAAPARRP